MGSLYSEEQLVSICRLLRQFTKYFLLPGLDIQLNVRGKVDTKNGKETFVTLETPPAVPASVESYLSEKSNMSTNGGGGGGYGSGNATALVVHAEFRLMDVIKDAKDLELSLRTEFQGDLNR